MQQQMQQNANQMQNKAQPEQANSQESVADKLKREEEKCHRIYYHFNAKDDIAHFISTYDHNGDPLPSFSSNPIRLKIEEDAKDFAEKLWASLNNDNKISLYVCHGQKEYIFNKNEGD